MTNVTEALSTHRKPLIMKERKVIYGFQLMSYIVQQTCVLKKVNYIQFERLPGLNNQLVQEFISEANFPFLVMILIDAKSNKKGSFFAFKVLNHLNPIYTRQNNRHGTPNFEHCAGDFKARHSQFSMCKRIGPKCNVALELKI